LYRYAAPLRYKTREIASRTNKPEQVKIKIDMGAVDTSDPVAINSLMASVSKSLEDQGLQDAVVEMQEFIKFQMELSPGPDLESWGDMRGPFIKALAKGFSTPTAEVATSDVTISGQQLRSSFMVSVKIFKKPVGAAMGAQLGAALVSVKQIVFSQRGVAASLGDLDLSALQTVASSALSSSAAEVGYDMSNVTLNASTPVETAGLNPVESS
jgi:hypothetical protein